MDPREVATDPRNLAMYQQTSLPAPNPAYAKNQYANGLKLTDSINPQSGDFHPLNAVLGVNT